MTNWISIVSSSLRYPSLIGGISFGNCCNYDNVYKQNTELTLNIGYLLSFLILSWVIYGGLKVIEQFNDS